MRSAFMRTASTSMPVAESQRSTSSNGKTAMTMTVVPNAVAITSTGTLPNAGTAKGGRMTEVTMGIVEKEFTFVNKYTRAGRQGKDTTCPHCYHVCKSYHFAWSASVCLNCKVMIEKNDWLLEKVIND